MSERMTDAQYLAQQDFRIIDRWQETQEVLNAAKNCLRKYHATLNSHGVSQAPSNQELSDLFQYLAYLAESTASDPQKTWAPDSSQDLHPLSTMPENSTGGLKGWFLEKESETPWNAFTARNRSSGRDVTDACSPTTKLLLPGPSGLQANSIIHEAPPFPLASESHHSSSEAVERPSTTRYASLHKVINTRGPSSIACSNDTSQVQWSQDSIITSLTTPPFPGTPVTQSHQPGVVMVGPLSRSPQSLEENPSNIASEQLGTIVARTRNRRPTFADIVGSQAPTPRQAVSSPTASNINFQPKNRFLCPFDGCGKIFEWEWKFTDHHRTHTREKPFSCMYCNAHFGRDRDLVKHKQSQKHRKAVGGLSIQTSDGPRGTISRTLSPAPRRSQRSQSPASASRPTRVMRAGRGGRGQASRLGNLIQSKRDTFSTGNEMELSKEFENTKENTQLPSNSTDISPISTTSPSRSGGKRTFSDIDFNPIRGEDGDIDGDEQGHGMDGFGSPLYQDSCQDMLCSVFQPSINHSETLLPSTSVLRQSISYPYPRANPPLLVSDGSLGGITFGSAYYPADTEWPIQNRVNVNDDESMAQYINYDPSQTTSAQPSTHWQSYSYYAGSDAGQG